MAIVIERERGREEKRNERMREKKMQQIFICVHADVLYVCRHCTDPDINFTEEREHTHERESFFFSFFIVYV
jgi:hypothetical protein